MNKINDIEISTKCDSINLLENFDSVSLDGALIEEKFDIKCEYKCRACESQVNLCSLFDNSDYLSKKFTLCTSLKINKNDQLPQHICKECLNELKIAYIFRMKCEKTQYKLQIALQKLEYKEDILVSNPLETQENKHELNETKTNNDECPTIKNESNFNIEKYDEETMNENELEYNNNDNIEDFIKEENNSLHEESDNDENNISNEDSSSQVDPSEYCENNINDSLQPGTSAEKQKPVKAMKSYICVTCGEEFHKFLEFNAHKKSHGIHRFQCKTCDKWFQQNCDLTRHLLAHTGEKNFKCTVCDKRFLLQKNVNRHMREVHKVPSDKIPIPATKRKRVVVESEDKTYECELCHKLLKSEAKLKLHKTRHLSKEFICQYCGKISKTRKDSQTHIRIHTGEKPYECKLCNKKFTQLSHLKSHMATHTDEKPFKCEICGLAFRESRSYKQHKFLHSGEKRHKCLVCEKAFARRDTLTVHMRIHTGERPYHCNLCPRKFHQSFDLTRHKLLHIGDKSFKCNFCEKAFVLRNNLAIHVKRVHNSENIK